MSYGTDFADSFRQVAALRQQLIVLQRKVRGRVQFTNSDRLLGSKKRDTKNRPRRPGAEMALL